MPRNTFSSEAAKCREHGFGNVEEVLAQIHVFLAPKKRPEIDTVQALNCTTGFGNGEAARKRTSVPT